MTKVGMAEAKAKLSELIDKVERGEEVVIARYGRPVVRLVQVEEGPKRRLFGALKGRIWMAPDWDAAMTEEELSEWYGKDAAGDTSSTPTS